MRIEGEIDKIEYNRRKQQLSNELREAQRHLPQATTEVKNIEGLLAKIDQIAEVVKNGSVAKRKELYATLFERIEQRDGELTALVTKEWARPLFENQPP